MNARNIIAVIALTVSTPLFAGTNVEDCKAFEEIAELAYVEYKIKGDEMAVLRKWRKKGTAAGAAANNGTNAAKQGIPNVDAAGRRAFKSCMDFMN